MEEYEEKELEEKFEEQEVYVSFKAESLSKRTLCLSSPGLCLSSEVFPTKYCAPEKEEVEEEEDEKLYDESDTRMRRTETLLYLLEELSDEEDAFEETVEFDRVAL